MDLLRRLDDDLDDDFRYFKLKSLKVKNADSKRRHKGFVIYVLSVATHAIGLKASYAPYNSPEEHMLAYIFEMFALNDKKIKKFLSDPQLKGKNCEGTLKRFHSWRPELRMRIQPPLTVTNDRVKPNELYVRVFIFKDNQKDIINDELEDLSLKNQNERRTWILRQIFKRRLRSSILIRPVKEMRALVGFALVGTGLDGNKFVSSKSAFKMMHMSNDTSVKKEVWLLGDSLINIRRYYCDPKNDYILRLEFWLNVQMSKISLVQRFRLFVRKFLSRGAFTHIEMESSRLKQNQEFYGYINMKLSQQPSYPTKHNHPILNLKERQIDRCEVSIDIQNRRIEERGMIVSKKSVLKKVASTSIQQKRPSLDYLVNHVRLYANCILYQCMSLKLNADFDYSQITLDNVFYLPAHTLINQHRLQSNIDRLGDLKLRRISLWVLIVKLDNLSSLESLSNDHILICKLITFILQNEYLRSRQKIDDRTIQEIDPFQDETETNYLRAFVANVELLAMKEFLKTVLDRKLRDFLMESDTFKRSDVRFLTLLYLKLFKTALKCIKKTGRRALKESESRIDILINLQQSVEKIIFETTMMYLKVRFRGIIDTDRPSPVDNKKPLSPAKRTRESPGNSWTKLFKDLKNIDHDLSIHWSRKGLNGILENQKDTIYDNEFLNASDEMNLKRDVQERLEYYL